MGALGALPGIHRIARREMKQAIGTRLRNLRFDNELTITTAARVLNMKRQHLGRLERGQSSLDLYILNLLAVYYGASVDYLLTGQIDRVLKKPLDKYNKSSHAPTVPIKVVPPVKSGLNFLSPPRKPVSVPRVEVPKADDLLADFKIPMRKVKKMRSVKKS